MGSRAGGAAERRGPAAFVIVGGDSSGTAGATAGLVDKPCSLAAAAWSPALRSSSPLDVNSRDTTTLVAANNSTAAAAAQRAGTKRGRRTRLGTTPAGAPSSAATIRDAPAIRPRASATASLQRAHSARCASTRWCSALSSSPSTHACSVPCSGCDASTCRSSFLHVLVSLHQTPTRSRQCRPH
jgi:hypothetical protein